MDIQSKKYLLDRVDDCKNGLCRWDDAAWSFIVNITNDNDSSLFELATPEIKEEIFKVIEQLHLDGTYTAYIAGVGALDSTARIENLERLLTSGSFIRT